MSTDYCIWRLQRRKLFVLFRNMCRYMFIYEPFRMMAEKAEIKMLNPSWRPSWHSEGQSTKWRGPAFKAEKGSRKNSPCSVHRMANTIYTPYHHYPMSQWHSTKWVKSFQEGPKLECFPSLLSSESSVEDRATAGCGSEQLRHQLPPLGNSLLHWC